MAYTKTVWSNGGGQPLSAANLDKLESGLQAAASVADGAAQAASSAAATANQALSKRPAAADISDSTVVGQALVTATTGSAARTTIGAGTYSKPANGIPKTDIDPSIFTTVYDKVCTAQTDSTDATTVVVPTGMSQTCAAGTWVVTGVVNYVGQSSDTDGDIKCSIIAPAGSTYSGISIGPATTATGQQGGTKLVSPQGSGLQQYGAYSPTLAAALLIQMRVTTTAAGDIRFGFAKAASTSTVPTSVLPGSYLTIAKVA